VSAGWLPDGYDAAVCLSVDDIHPGRSDTHYEAGGELEAGVLGRLAWLAARHPALRVTICVTPDWRELSPRPTRTRLAALPGASRLPLASRLPRGAMRLERHQAFVDYLRALGFEIAVHGLYHFGPGHRPPHEFDHLGVLRARRRLRRARKLFERVGLPVEPGFAPPAWRLTPALERAVVAEGFTWVGSARDLSTPIVPGVKAAGTGLHGVDLIAPQRIAGGRLVHVPVNIQVPLDRERADRIVEVGGLVSIKAHAVVEAFGYVSPDGLDQAHVERLDAFLTHLEDRHGDRLWWATVGEVARRA
jgi:hypothetical protein